MFISIDLYIVVIIIERGILLFGYRLIYEPIFQKYGVDLTFAGHVHYYERIFVNGIHYIVTGAGGCGGAVVVENPPAYSHFQASGATGSNRDSFTLVTVYKERLELKQINSSGRVFDGVTIYKDKCVDLYGKVLSKPDSFLKIDTE